MTVTELEPRVTFGVEYPFAWAIVVATFMAVVSVVVVHMFDPVLVVALQARQLAAASEAASAATCAWWCFWYQADASIASAATPSIAVIARTTMTSD